MKYATIDIGSNSVRLMISIDDLTLSKRIKTTALGQNLQQSGILNNDAMTRTSEAVFEFAKIAKSEGADKLFCFATEAVRSAANGKDFALMLKNGGVDVTIIPSSEEARLGFVGAYTEGECCVLDIGGASTELCVGNAEKIAYAKSLPLGVVRLRDLFGEDTQQMQRYIKKVILDYGQLPRFETLLGIGGSPTAFVAIIKQMQVYDPLKVNNTVITKSEIVEATRRIHAMSMDERLNVAGLAIERRNVIVGGGTILVSIMDYLNVDTITARESDNLEGFLKCYVVNEK